MFVKGRHVARGIEQQPRDGDSQCIQELGVARVEAVVGTLWRPADENHGVVTMFINMVIICSI